MVKKFEFLDEIVTNTIVRATYQNSDQMGVVYYANYFIWFEIGRVEFLRRFGTAYRDLEKKGIILPVKKCGCEYFKPARFDDIVRIETILKDLTKISISFKYNIYLHPEVEKLASGETEHVFISPDGKIQRAGEKIYDILSGWDKKKLQEYRLPMSNVSQ